MLLDGIPPSHVIGQERAHDLVVELAGRFRVPVPEVQFTCQFTHRGWYHLPECGCGCQRHKHGSIRLGRKGAMLSVVLHEFAHHLVRHKLKDWERIPTHGWDFKRYQEQAHDHAFELGMKD